MTATSRSDSRPHVVIIGGGFGGLSAARALGRAPVRVTLIDRQNYHLFQPLLYQVATTSLAPNDIAHPIRSILRRQPNTAVVMAEVRSIDVANRRVVLPDRAIAYDHLIVAAGASHSYFGHAEWEARAPGLKDLDDALRIRHRLLLAFEKAELESDRERQRALLTFVIVGAGPTGVELAGALGELACNVMARDFRHVDPQTARIILAEAGPRVLPAFPASLSAKAEASLRRMCVEVRLGAPVSTIEPGRVVIGDEEITAETVIWAAGVEASPLGRSFGVPLDRSGRVLVEPDLSLPGRPEVYVIGDLAACLDESGTALPGLAPVAIQQGGHAARNIARRCAGQDTRPFRYKDRGTLATIGRGSAVAEFGRLKLSGFFAWVTWALIHILLLIGFRNRIVVFIEWAWAYITGQRSARLISREGDDGVGPAATEHESA